VPETLSGAVSAGREGQACVMLVCFFYNKKKVKKYHFEPPKQKRTYAGVGFVYEN
jgi:hypothetical protein